MISPLAYIHPEAKIGENCEIAPFVYIDKNVVIGDNNKIMSNASILYGARIGNGNTIFPGAVISAIPQDLKFRGEETTISTLLRTTAQAQSYLFSVLLLAPWLCQLTHSM